MPQPNVRRRGPAKPSHVLQRIRVRLHYTEDHGFTEAWVSDLRRVRVVVEKGQYDRKKPVDAELVLLQAPQHVVKAALR